MAFQSIKLTNKDVLTQNSFQITIEQLPNVYFTSFSGFKETKESGSYNDGVSNRTRYTDGGIFSVENVTFEVPFDIETSNQIEAWVNTFRDGGVVDITVRPVRISQTGGVTPLSKSWSAGNCRFVSMDLVSEVSAGSSDVAMISLELSVEFLTAR